MVKPNTHYTQVVGGRAKVFNATLRRLLESIDNKLDDIYDVVSAEGEPAPQDKGTDALEDKIGNIHDAVIADDEPGDVEADKQTISQRIDSLQKRLEELHTEYKERVEEDKNKLIFEKEEERKERQADKEQSKFSILGMLKNLGKSLINGVDELLSKQFLNKIKMVFFGILAVAALILFGPLIGDIFKSVFGPVWEKIKAFMYEKMPGWVKGIMVVLNFLKKVLNLLYDGWSWFINQLFLPFSNALFRALKWVLDKIPGASGAVKLIESVQSVYNTVFRTITADTAEEKAYAAQQEDKEANKARLQEALNKYDADNNIAEGASRKDVVNAINVYENIGWDRYQKTGENEPYQLSLPNAKGEMIDFGMTTIPKDIYESILKGNTGKTGDYVFPTDIDADNPFSNTAYLAQRKASEEQEVREAELVKQTAQTIEEGRAPQPVTLPEGSSFPIGQSYSSVSDVVDEKQEPSEATPTINAPIIQTTHTTNQTIVNVNSQMSTTQ